MKHPPHILIFGLGYSASVIAQRLATLGWHVEATGSSGKAFTTLEFDDLHAVAAALQRASHVLSSVPPTDGADPVLVHHGAALAEAAQRGAWLSYLSSTGVYGDTGGAWVDESAPAGGGRRTARMDADAQWLLMGARVFRLPGIYGPGRSAFDRIRNGTAHRIDAPNQIFSRIHVEDLANGVLAAIAAKASPGAWNLADDEPAPPNAIIEDACRRLGLAPPPMLQLDDSALSPMARAFYQENRRVANGKAKRLLGWRLRYPSWREGLAAITETSSLLVSNTKPI